jgi:hypothetical protein
MPNEKMGLDARRGEHRYKSAPLLLARDHLQCIFVRPDLTAHSLES